MFASQTHTCVFLCFVAVFFTGCIDNSNADESSDTNINTDTILRYNSEHSFFALDTAREQVNLATGALFCNERNPNGEVRRTEAGNTVRVTCGLTFISPRYAITAAHCVDTNSCGGDDMTFPVRQYDISRLDMARWKAATSVQNIDDSNYEKWTFGDYLTEEDGYGFEEYECRTEVLCLDGQSGRNSDRCTEDGSRFTGDIALIYCPTRDASAPFVDVAESVHTGDTVRAHWFFELTDFPLPRSDTDETYTQVNRYYNAYSPDKDSFHYIGFDSARETQLYPLVSAPWDDMSNLEAAIAALSAGNAGLGDDSDFESLSGADYASLVAETGEHVVLRICDNLIQSDIWACHGMSGSGVFQVGTDGEERLIGPVLMPGWDSTTYATLCESAHAGPGQSLIQFTKPGRIRDLTTWARASDGR